MKKSKLIFLGGILLLSLASCSDNNDSVDRAEHANEQMEHANTNVVDKDASEFAVKAADGGMLEVELGKMASEKGMRQEVKDFGNLMVKDHTALNDKLKAIAAHKNIVLPTTLSSESQKHMDDLAKKNGHDFDKAYIDLMQKDHEDDIKDFENAVKDVKDADINNFATDALPTLRTHLEHCNSIKDLIK